MQPNGNNAQLASSKRQMIVGLLDKVCQQVEITEAQFQTAKGRYEAVGTWLSESNSPHLKKVEIYPQGSIALGTAIKPILANEFDVDLVCHLPNIGNTSTAQAVKALIGTRLKEHATYKGMLEEKQRCWRINYANEFHLDITPSIINPNCRQGGELVPDKTMGQWKPTNPKGYINRFEQYAAISPQFQILERKSATVATDSIEPLPEPTGTKPILKRIVQILKRHRDQRFLGSSHAELAPISVIITTLAARAYAACAKQVIYADEFGLITAVIKTMPIFIHIEMRSGKPYYTIENETTAGENFADKWNEDPKRATAFNQWHADALSSIEGLLQIEGVDKFADSLSKNFGGKESHIRDILSKLTTPIGQARSAGILSVAPSVGLVSSPTYGAVNVPKNTFFGL